MFLLTYEHLEKIGLCFTSSLLLLLQVQLPTKLVGKFFTRFSCMQHLNYILSNIRLEKTIGKRICFIKGGEGNPVKEGLSSIQSLQGVFIGRYSKNSLSSSISN